MKLLLVDDDTDQLELRSLTFAKAGYGVCVASSVPEALRVAAEETPDAAIVDLNLPSQEAGLRLIRGLKKLDSRLRVIILTGANMKKMDGTPERGLVEAVFTKGSGSRELVAYLRKVT